jgi:hypothetical protein
LLHRRRRSGAAQNPVPVFQALVAELVDALP